MARRWQCRATWMDDFSQRLVVDEGGNTMRWMHVTPGKQIIEACDRQGLMESMPAGDQEGMSPAASGPAHGTHARRHHLQQKQSQHHFL